MSSVLIQRKFGLSFSGSPAPEESLGRTMAAAEPDATCKNRRLFKPPLACIIDVSSNPV
jgi:hypothetical protein